jgi:hypothetical protein
VLPAEGKEGKTMQQCPACTTVCGAQARYCGGCGRRLPAAPTSLLADRYRLVERVDRGGFSTVWRGADLHMGGRMVAVKVLAMPAAAEDAPTVLAWEAAVLASLRHPAIPVIYDHITIGSRHYLVMDYVEGSSLHALLAVRRHPVPEPQVRDWALQLSEVLAYLHGRQPPVVFRDLKPANILLAPDGRLRLVDFGIARRLAPGRADTVALGTAGYASPEHYGGHTDARSDLYSLGATLHHLLTLRDPSAHPPFAFPPVRALNPAISAALATLVEQLLQWRPEDRPAAAAQVASALCRPDARGTAESAPVVSPSAPRVPRAILVLRELGRGADEEATAQAVSRLTGLSRAQAQARLRRLPVVLPLLGISEEALVLAHLRGHGCTARRVVSEAISATLVPEARARLARHGHLVLRDHAVEPGGYGYCRRCGYHWLLAPAAAVGPPAACPRCRRRDWSTRRLCRCGWCGHEFELADYRREPTRWCPTCACCGLRGWEQPGKER